MKKSLVWIIGIVLLLAGLASAQEIRRPTAWAGQASTSGESSAHCDGCDSSASLVYSGFTAASAAYSSLTVYVSASCTNYGDGCYIYINVGATVYLNQTIYTTTGQTTYSAVLPAGTAESSITVQVTGNGITYCTAYLANGTTCKTWGGNDYGAVTVYDIWSSGVIANTAPTVILDVPANGATVGTQWQPGLYFSGWAIDAESGGGTTIYYSLDGAGWTQVTGRNYRGDVTGAYNAGWYWNLPANNSLGVGGHTFVVTGTDGTLWTNSPTNTFYISAEPYPATTTNMAATPSANGTSVALTWTLPSSGQYYQYADDLIRCTGAGCTPTSTPTWLTQNNTGNPVSYTDAVAPCTTYGYQNAAMRHDFGGNWSTTIYATTPCLPSSPTGVTATAAANGLTATVSWTNNSSGNGYAARVHRSVNGGADIWEDLTGVSSKVYASVPGNTITFYVEAVNSVGAKLVWVPAVPATLNIPNVPNGAAISAIANANGISSTLSWHATGATSYNINRCQGVGCNAYLALWTGTSVTTQTDSGLTPGQSYGYQVVPINPVGSGTSATSSDIMPSFPNGSPSGLVVTPDANGLHVALSWYDNSNNETGFNIQTCPGNCASGFGEWVDGLAANATSTYQPVATCSSWTFQVYAYNLVGAGGFSNRYYAATPCAPIVPGLGAVTAQPNGTQVLINWVNGGGGTPPTSNEVWSCTGVNCTPASGVTGLAAGATSYLWSGLTPGTTYRFLVVARNAVGTTTSGTSLNTLTPAYALAPTGLSLTGIYSGKLTLNWIDNSTTETVWTISRCSGSAGCTPIWLNNPASGTTASTGATSWGDTGLVPATIYCYQVDALNLVGDSAPTFKVCATTMAVPPQVSGTVVTPATNGLSNTLTWSNPGGTATHIGIHYCAGVSCGGDTSITDVALPTLTYTHSGLTPGQSYTYLVFSWNTNDNPPYYNVELNYTVVMPNFPGTPAITVVAVGSRAISLSWPTVSNLVSFLLERCQGTGCSSFTTLSSGLATSATSYLDSGLTSGLSYTYRLTSTNLVGSRASNQAATVTWGRMRPQKWNY